MILLSQIPSTYWNVLTIFLHMIPTCLTPCHDHNIHRVVCGQACKQYFPCISWKVKGDSTLRGIWPMTQIFFRNNFFPILYSKELYIYMLTGALNIYFKAFGDQPFPQNCMGAQLGPGTTPHFFFPYVVIISGAHGRGGHVSVSCCLNQLEGWAQYKPKR